MAISKYKDKFSESVCYVRLETSGENTRSEKGYTAKIGGSR
ncbi:MAG TPA: hypothetical protein VGK00_14365 [Anaerolineales bacterium]|jgi:hypothetical protein